MRGSPLLRALLVFCGLVWLALPLWRLTYGQSEVSNAGAGGSVTDAAGSLKAIGLQLDFSQPPTEVKVLHLGKEVLEEKSPGSSIQRNLKIAYPKEGVELAFEVRWPQSGLSAMRVILKGPDGGKTERTVWAEGEVDEVLSFP